MSCLETDAAVKQAGRQTESVDVTLAVVARQRVRFIYCTEKAEAMECSKGQNCDEMRATCRA